MNSQNYLIDTNVFIGLEDDKKVSDEVAKLHALANKHSVGVFVHEAARDDIARDTNASRKAVSLSKIAKFQSLPKVRGLAQGTLEQKFGPLPKPNDVVDATLLHALESGAADFLVTQDRGLHSRARNYAPELSRRVLFVADATALLKSTYEPLEVPVRSVEEVSAHEIPADDDIFDSLREGYPGFDKWWKKCVKNHRRCWAVFDGQWAGLIVRKDETKGDTYATLPGEKILKICTFKVRPEKRGVKLGELLLKKALWFAQANKYDVVYLTTKIEQAALIDLIEYYGFRHTTTVGEDELVYEKSMSSEELTVEDGSDLYEVARLNYPRFYSGDGVEGYTIPIQEAYHDTLFPELKDRTQGDLLEMVGIGSGPKRPGNTIRKVYLCRAQANIRNPGSILFFYKSASGLPPSQAITTVGIFEDMQLAKSYTDLVRLAGGRSVYSDRDLRKWDATEDKPIKVINFLLAGYFDPAISLDELKRLRVFGGGPPQAISRLSRARLNLLLENSNLGFAR